MPRNNNGWNDSREMSWRSIKLVNDFKGKIFFTNFFILLAYVLICDGSDGLILQLSREKRQANSNHNSLNLKDFST